MLTLSENRPNRIQTNAVKTMTLEEICNKIELVFDKMRVPFTYIPATLLVCSAVKRPGLSAILIASNIIRRASEAGAIPGPAADGGRNVAEAMERIRAEEYVNAIKRDLRIQVGIPMGAINIMGTCQTPAGPGTIQGINTSAIHGEAVPS